MQISNMLPTQSVFSNNSHSYILSCKPTLCMNSESNSVKYTRQMLYKPNVQTIFSNPQGGVGNVTLFVPKYRTLLSLTLHQIQLYLGYNFVIFGIGSQTLSVLKTIQYQVLAMVSTQLQHLKGVGNELSPKVYHQCDHPHIQ